MAKTGLLITTYNRPEYLEQCIESLKKVDLKDVLVLFLDDASTNAKTKQLINNFPPHYFIANKENSGIAASLLKGFDFLFSMGCDYAINLDSDAIVSPRFIESLTALKKRFPEDIITGFNTLTKNEHGKPRHPIFIKQSDHVIKKTAGGINYLISKDLYEQWVKPSLFKCLDRKTDWDNYLCSQLRNQGIRFVCTTPSVVDHIGEESSICKRINPDRAFDFDKEIKKDTIVINQPRGLGDIIFSMRAVLDFANGRKIIWPVVEGFEDIQKHFPDIEFVNWKSLKINYDIREEYQSDYGLVIPLRFSDSICQVKYFDCMKSKYMYFSSDWNNWKNINVIRDVDKEEDLYNTITKNFGDKKYNLINTNFRTDKSGKANNIVPHNNYIDVYMDTLPGYTLVDWSKVIENAENIYTVGTSINYLIELLNPKAKQIHLYVRRPEEADFKNYEYILSKDKPYIFHL